MNALTDMRTKIQISETEEELKRLLLQSTSLSYKRKITGSLLVKNQKVIYCHADSRLIRSSSSNGRTLVKSISERGNWRNLKQKKKSWETKSDTSRNCCSTSRRTKRSWRVFQLSRSSTMAEGFLWFGN